MIINKTFIININIVGEISNNYFNNQYLFIDIDYIDFDDLNKLNSFWTTEYSKLGVDLKNS